MCVCVNIKTTLAKKAVPSLLCLALWARTGPQTLQLGDVSPEHLESVGNEAMSLRTLREVQG